MTEFNNRPPGRVLIVIPTNESNKLTHQQIHRVYVFCISDDCSCCDRDSPILHYK